MGVEHNTSDEFGDFFSDLGKIREVSIKDDKFKQKDSKILKYEYFNEKLEENEIRDAEDENKFNEKDMGRN